MALGKIGWAVVGGLDATIGVQVLRSKEAKKVYTVATAAVLREKDTIMKNVTEIREECSDIYADAVEMNEKRAAEQEQIIADRDAKKAEECCCGEEEKCCCEDAETQEA